MKCCWNSPSHYVSYMFVDLTENRRLNLACMRPICKKGIFVFVYRYLSECSHGHNGLLPHNPKSPKT